MQSISKVAVWGNTNNTIFPDLRNASIDGISAVKILEKSWIYGEYHARVQNRSNDIVKLRVFGAAASYSSAVIDHMRDWLYGSNEWHSMGIKSDKYRGIIPEGLVFSMPVTTANGKYSVVEGISFDDEQANLKLTKTIEEL